MRTAIERRRARDQRRYRANSGAGYEWEWVNWLVYDHEWVLPVAAVGLSFAALVLLGVAWVLS